ncbi:MAG: hypothetical protein OXC54_00740 [Rhodospirillaceae bacterium]|nr:hypothetical protein [Rhodospirillaceae bacterium]
MGATVSHQVVVRVQSTIEIAGRQFLHDLMKIETFGAFSPVESRKICRNVKQGPEYCLGQTQVSRMQVPVYEDQPAIVILGTNFCVVPILAADFISVSIRVVEMSALRVQQTRELYVSGCVKSLKAVQVDCVRIC